MEENVSKITVNRFTQDLPVTNHHDVYPGIEPSKFKNTLAGKVVFVTGASRGIGQATARAFAMSGASLFLAARKDDTLEAAKQEILKDTPEAKIAYYATDVVSSEDVKAAVEACVKEYGKIDVVINNSGAADPMRNLVDSVPEDWWWTW